MSTQKQVLLVLTVVALLSSGCSTFRSYKDESLAVVQDINMGNLDHAIVTLDKNVPRDKDILYFMEKGEVLRLKKSFSESFTTWMEAEKMVDDSENEAKITLGKVGGWATSLLVNDKSMRYDGQDYEKVLLSTRLALDHISMGNLEGARVQIKKTHEREAIIEELHSKEIQEQEEEAKSKGITTTMEDLKGYPVATLNSSEVTQLKNSYQSAFSHYLAGYLYESLGEVGLAAPGYKKAIEINPNVQTIKNDLSGLDQRVAERGHKTYVDVLFVIENGFAPTVSSMMIPIPAPVVGIVPISFPLLDSDPSAGLLATTIKLPTNNMVTLEKITNIDAMAKKSLRDRLPAIIIRGLFRAAAKGASQAAAYKQDHIAGLVVNAINVATESADERTWKTVPSSISIARAKLPLGKNKIIVNSSIGPTELEVDVKADYAVVPMRLLPNSLILLQ